MIVNPSADSNISKNDMPHSKARTHIYLADRKKNDESVDDGDIRKHKNHIIRLRLLKTQAS